MPSNNRNSAPGRSQADSRVVKIFWDQHKDASAGHPEGRAFWAYCEKQVNGSDAQPVGEVAPVTTDMRLEDGTVIKGWSAPWLPEQKYIMLAVSSMQGSKIRLDYQAMRRDYEEASRNYYDLVNNEAHAAKWEPIPMYGEVPYFIRALKHVGAPPKSPKIPEAASAGDKWLLGFSREPNERLAEILSRDNGRMAATPAERQHVPKDAEFTPEEIEQAAAALRQAKKMRDAKAAKATAGTVTSPDLKDAA